MTTETSAAQENLQEPDDIALPSFDLTGKVAVVVGATIGIGRAIAVGYALAGARTVLVGRDAERLEQVRASVAARGGSATVETVDLRDVAALGALAQRVADTVGPTDVLVNSAGVPLRKPAVEVAEDDWDLVVDTGLKGTFFCAQAFGRGMVARGEGAIINVTSTDATTARPTKAVYCATKAGVSHLTATLAAEWGAHGVRVNALAPTATRTETRPRFADPATRAEVSERIPLGRIGVPADLVGAAIFLASPAAQYVTGHVLYVDGGYHTIN